MAPRLLRYLGDASYSIYLAHGIVIFVVDRSANLNVGNSWRFKIMLIAAATSAGVVLYELERFPTLLNRKGSHIAEVF